MHKTFWGCCVIEVLDILSNTTVCPFRTEVRMGQRLNEDGVPEQYQITLFPECQYRLCPFFNEEGKNNSERCYRATMG